MELFADTHIDFMKYRKFWITVSLVLLLVGVFAVFVHGKLNVGIDFAGGTQLTIKFDKAPEMNRVRALVGGAGVGETELQRFGALDAHEVMIKTPTLKGSEEGSRDRVVSALDKYYNKGATQSFDLNQKGAESLAEFLFKLDPDQVKAADPDTARTHYRTVADAIDKVKQDNGLLHSWDEVAKTAGVSPEILNALKQNARIGSFSVLGVQNVGPQIGSELRKKGILAVVFSLIGMLIYIWVRFELRFGIGALMASIHDVIVTLGLFALFGFEFNLTTIAAFLTLVGYSVNDTVVVFDRIREDMRKSRTTPLIDTMNLAINQTLSRTILTSGTTFLAVLSLLILGGDVLRGFSFIMTIGVVVGTYSSIYIASPFALLWEQLFGKQAQKKRKRKK
ncbi:MAG TPA: protein translocase subunit SecF [Thermoanaerobaculia bacterium]|nr:protein translocase subunit SecF [Thermoanaerobaculia bacterium]